MKRLRCILLLLLQVKTVIVFTQGTKLQELQNETPSHRGKSFLLGFLEMDDLSGVSAIYITSSMTAEINITVPFENRMFTEHTTPGVSTKVNLTTNIRMRGVSRENKGILITANTTVSVYATNARKKSRDVYVIFPTSTLGTQHVVATYTPIYKSLVGVIALRDNTLIQIKLRLRGNITYMGRVYRNADILRIFLNKLQTFQLQHSEDLTGTFVISTEPVVVLGGNICAMVQIQNSKCSHLATQMVPVSKWGTRFVTSPIPNRKRGDVFRIVAGFNDTVARIHGKWNFTLLAGEYEEFSLKSTESRYITCSEPAMLIQYNKGSYNIQYEPFALMVPPIAQYANEYNLPIGVEYLRPSFYNYIILIVKTSEFQSIVFNASKLCYSEHKITLDSTPNYTVYTCKLYIGLSVSTEFSITHTSHGGRFAAYMVGHTDSDGYGYSGGMEMRDLNCERLFPKGLTIGDTADNDCDGKIDEEVENGVDDDGDGRIDEDTGSIITSCNLKSAMAERSLPRSEYLNGSEFKYTVANQYCEALITRTWSFRTPNGSRVIAATQEIRWRKQKPTIVFPSQTHLTSFNLSVLERLARAMSSFCPGEILEFKDSSSITENGTKLIEIQWIIQEDCGRVTTADQEIIVHPNDSVVKKQEKKTSSSLVLILSTTLGIPIVILAMVMCIILAWRKHVSGKITVSALHINVREANEKRVYYKNPPTAEDANEEGVCYKNPPTAEDANEEEVCYKNPPTAEDANEEGACNKNSPIVEEANNDKVVYYKNPNTIEDCLSSQTYKDVNHNTSESTKLSE